MQQMLRATDAGESIVPDTPRDIVEPITSGFQTRDLAQITDDMIAQQAVGAAWYTGLGLPPLYAVVRLIASTVDQLDLTVGDDATWLSRPRRYGSQLDAGDLIQWIVTSMALRGRAYLLVEKPSPGSRGFRIDALHPDDVQAQRVKRGKYGHVGLEFRANGELINPVPATLEEWIVKGDRGEPTGVRGPYLLHIPYMVTPDYPEGISPVQAAYRSMVGYMTVEQQATQLLGQGTYSGGRLETDQDITETTAARWQDKWIENRLTGKLPVLGAGLRYVNDLIDPRDAQWLESRLFNAQQVAQLYGVPPDYLGMAMSGGSSSLSYANSQDNDRRFRRNCLEAFTSQIEDALSQLTGESQPVRFDYSEWEVARGADTTDPGPTDPGER